MLARSSAQAIAEQWAAWASALREAKGGAWQAHDTYLRMRGASYAALGLSFQASSALLHELDRQLLPELIDAYVAEPPLHYCLTLPRLRLGTSQFPKPDAQPIACAPSNAR